MLFLLKLQITKEYVIFEVYQKGAWIKMFRNPGLQNHNV